jgi:hypothetical protein
VLYYDNKEEDMTDPFADQLFRMVSAFTRAQAEIYRAAMPVGSRSSGYARTPAPHPVGPVAVLAELLRALPGVWRTSDTHAIVDGATAELRDPEGRRYRVAVTVLP